MSTIEIKVPDLGEVKDVQVIELLIKVGDTVRAEQSLITLESEKATLDVPTPVAGTVKEIKVSAGDKVSKGTVIVLLEPLGSADSAGTKPAADSGTAAKGKKEPAPAKPPAAEAAPRTEKPVKDSAAENKLPEPAPAKMTTQFIEIKVPDLGEVKDVQVIELLIKVGDAVRAEQSLITLESEKATLDVPTPVAGTVKEIKVSAGDNVSKGTVIVLLETAGTAAKGKPEPAPAKPPATEVPPKTEKPVKASAAENKLPEPAEMAAPLTAGTAAHATPSVRHLARELGVQIAQVKGSGPKGRITADDLKLHVKTILKSASAPGSGAGALGGFNLLPWPKIDFSAFGPVEIKPLSRIRKLISANLGRNWVMIPHVTQFDSADITDLETHRVGVNKAGSAEGIKLTMLAYLIKACVEMLKKFPDFNASLDGDTLVMKSYFNIGFAADTPQGLMVPVVRDADKKSVVQVALETAALAGKARDGKIAAAEMQGGCFTISSLGGVGGTSFTPIINAPEVAILGVSRSEMLPYWNGKEFVPRLMLPLSLSYDHRVIDGATAARFTRQLAELLADVKNIPA